MRKSKILSNKSDRLIFFEELFRKFIGVDGVESILNALDLLGEREINVDWFNYCFFGFF